MLPTMPCLANATREGVVVDPVEVQHFRQPIDGGDGRDAQSVIPIFNASQTKIKLPRLIGNGGAHQEGGPEVHEALFAVHPLAAHTQRDSRFIHLHVIGVRSTDTGMRL